MDELVIEKHIIDPNGDVIIRLHNYNEPFAVLQPDQELFVPSQPTGGLFGSTSIFSSSKPTVPSGGLFGSTTSSSTTAPSSSSRLFGSAISGSNSTVPSGGLFGSTTSSSSTSAPSSGPLFGAGTFCGTAPSFGSAGLFGSTSSSSSTSAPSSGPPFGSGTFSGTTPSFGSAGLFGSAPRADAAAPPSFSGLFGSTTSGSAASSSTTVPLHTSSSLFGSAASPSPGRSPSTVTSSGTVTFSSSTGADSSSRNTPTPSQPLNDGIENRSARGTNDDTVEHEKQTGPSKNLPEIRLQVSSAHLKLASRYFQKAFSGDFKESRPDIDGLLCIDASGWDTEALLIVFRIIHGQPRRVPKFISLELLAKIAVIVDYYDCLEVFDLFAEFWLQRLKDRFILLHKLDRELILLLLVSWVFRWAHEFKLVTKIALRHSKGLLCTLDLPIPDAITSAINTRRRDVLNGIKFALRSLDAHFRSEPPPCSFECASINLGALSRQMEHTQELKNLTSVLRNFEGQDVVSMFEAARTIRSPNWPCKRHKEASTCNLSSRVKTVINKLDVLDGLDLKEFVLPA